MQKFDFTETCNSTSTSTLMIENYLFVYLSRKKYVRTNNCNYRFTGITYQRSDSYYVCKFTVKVSLYDSVSAKAKGLMFTPTMDLLILSTNMIGEVTAMI